MNAIGLQQNELTTNKENMHMSCNLNSLWPACVIVVFFFFDFRNKITIIYCELSPNQLQLLRHAYDLRVLFFKNIDTN